MEQDTARRLVVDRALVAAAFGHLTEAFTDLPFESLGAVKTLLKRYLSTTAWSAKDDDELADAVGAGDGWWERTLDADVSIGFGWDGGRFRVDVRSGAVDTEQVEDRTTADPLDATFEGPVVPEATPNPRTIRFGFRHPLHDGPSRWYESAAATGDDPRVARLFDDVREVANVLVGGDFVAVSLRRPADWEALLAPVLAVVTDAFSDPDQQGGRLLSTGAKGGPAVLTDRPAQPAGDDRRLSRLEQAWRDLGALRPVDPADLATLLAAASGPDQSHRQVAANLLREADPAPARDGWSRLAVDPVRAVRRAAVDAMVEAGRDDLRPLLEAALGDTDAWVRWKALRGLVELGPGPSLDAIVPTTADPDFRVRLEAAAALRAGSGDE